MPSSLTTYVITDSFSAIPIIEGMFWLYNNLPHTCNIADKFTNSIFFLLCVKKISYMLIYLLRLSINIFTSAFS